MSQYPKAIPILLFTAFCISHVVSGGVLRAAAETPDISFPDECDSTDPKCEQLKCGANMCFALDGSSSISANAFLQQRRFVLQVLKPIGRRNQPGLAAVQYGTANSPISPFTNNFTEFRGLVRSTVQLGSTGSFLTGGLNYCFSELFEKPGNNVIVLFGDGRNDLGSDPVSRAKEFFQTGGKVLTVGVGPAPDIRFLREIAGNSTENVFALPETGQISDEVEKAIRTICA